MNNVSFTEEFDYMKATFSVYCFLPFEFYFFPYTIFLFSLPFRYSFTKNFSIGSLSSTGAEH